MELGLPRVCLRVEHGKFSQQGFLCSRGLTVRAAIPTSRHCCQALVGAVLWEGQQFFWDFGGHLIFLVGKLRFVPLVILPSSFYNDEEGLPGGVFIVDLQRNSQERERCVSDNKKFGSSLYLMVAEKVFGLESWNGLDWKGT